MSQKLGKAKRDHTEQLARAARAGETLMVMEGDKRVPGRHSGMTYTEAVQHSLVERPVSVPCNGCTACCHGKRIEVSTKNEPAERLAHMDLVDDCYGDKKLRRNEETGACVHLGPEGCTIYEYRPQTCRTYDCRLAGLMGMRRAHETPHGDVVEPLWVFEIKSKADSVEYATTTAITDIIRAAGMPENPNDLMEAVAALYKRLKPEFQDFMEILPDEVWQNVEKRRAKAMGLR